MIIDADSAEAAQRRSRGLALLALLLLVPVPSLGVYAGLIAYPQTGFGRGLFIAAKLWVLFLPLVWTTLVERRALLPARPPRHNGLRAGVASGALFGIAIVAACALFGRAAVDVGPLREVAAGVAMDAPLRFAALAAYWVFVNALLEEYVWRWFVLGQLCRLLRPVLAVPLAAAAFTLHHVVVTQLYLPPPLVALAALAVFVAGLVWGAMVRYYGSLWPGYVSHVIADVAIFAAGYWLLFG